MRGASGEALGSALILRLVVIGSVFLSISGCKPEIEAGLYEGALFKKIDDKIFSDKNVRVRIAFENAYSAQINAENIHNEKLESIEVVWSKKHDLIKMRIPTLSQKQFKLTPIETNETSDHWKCYRASEQYILSACFIKNEFFLNVSESNQEVMVYSLNGKIAPQQTSIPFEEAKSYKLSEVIELALAKNFDTLIEYQAVAQSREAARAAFYNLLPHVAFKDLFAIGFLNPASIFSYIADFVPFLIPTRWMKVHEADDLSFAERITYDLLKAEVGYQVESLSHTYEMNRVQEMVFQKFLIDYQPVYDHIRSISKGEIGVLGNNLDEIVLRLDSLMNFAQQEINRIDNTLVLNKTALSASIGFQNPRAVNHVEIDEPDDSIESAPALIKEDIVKMALERSLELRQLDYLIDSAEFQRRELYFNWMDPDVPASQNISFSLIPYRAKATAFIRQIKAQRSKMQNTVQTRAENAVLNYTYSIEAYKIVKKGLSRLQERNQLIQLEILNAKSASEIKTTGGNFQWALNLEFQFMLKLYQTIANFRVSRALIKRVLLEDYYARFDQDLLPVPRLIAK